MSDLLPSRGPARREAPLIRRGHPRGQLILTPVLDPGRGVRFEVLADLTGPDGSVQRDAVLLGDEWRARRVLAAAEPAIRDGRLPDLRALERALS